MEDDEQNHNDGMSFLKANIEEFRDISSEMRSMARELGQR